jgi:hypothetical protein
VHPLFGRLLEARSFKRWEGEVLLVVVLPDGTPGTIPVDATSLAEEPVEAQAAAVVLSVEGVRRLRAAVEALTPGSRKRSRTRK